MLNPIAKNKNYFITFAGVWSFIFVVQTFILNYFYGFNWQISIVDSAVFNFLFALIGFNMWYVIRFNLRETLTGIDLVINHIIIAVVIITLWLGASWFTLRFIFAGNDLYLQFLNDTLPWRAVTGIFFYLLFILFYYVILYYEDLQDKMKIESELQNLVNKAELSALKSQINPHFLFNSLNSISSLTITNPEKAQEMVIKLSDFLRYSLNHDETEKTSLKEEFDNLHRYLDIEKVRFGHRLNFKSNIDEQCIDQEIPNMILQPLIENAIKHGVYHSTEEVLIEMTCKIENGFLIIELINDYDPEAVKKKGQGIGLTNIRKRLQLIYKRQDLLITQGDKMIYRVTLKIPINGENK